MVRVSIPYRDRDTKMANEAVKEYKNKQKECDWYIPGKKEYCAVGRKNGIYCFCTSPKANVRNRLLCPYWWRKYR